MRIRKNRKLSNGFMSLGVDHVKQLQPHLCQLNQSPWDAIPFSQESLHQFERVNNFDGNETFHRLSVLAAAADREKEATAKKRVDVNNGIERRNPGINQQVKIESEFKIKKLEDDGSNGWLCRNKHKKAENTCDLHFIILNSCTGISNSNDNLINTPIKSTERVISGARIERPRTAKKARSLSTDRREFYYYSGFGPLWGKKKDRGEGHKSKIGSIDTERLLGAAVSVGAGTT